MHMLFYMLNVCTLFILIYIKHVFNICRHFSCDIPINSQKIVISLIRGSDPLRWRVLSDVPMYCCGRRVSKPTILLKVLGTDDNNLTLSRIQRALPIISPSPTPVRTMVQRA